MINFYIIFFNNLEKAASWQDAQQNFAPFVKNSKSCKKNKYKKITLQSSQCAKK
jgi:hypothetical protein